MSIPLVTKFFGRTTDRSYTVQQNRSKKGCFPIIICLALDCVLSPRSLFTLPSTNIHLHLELENIINSEFFNTLILSISNVNKCVAYGHCAWRFSNNIWRQYQPYAYIIDKLTPCMIYLNFLFNALSVIYW